MLFRSIAAHAVTIALEAARRGRDGWRLAEQWAASQLAVVAAYLPWLAVFAWQFSLVQRGFWIPDPRAYMVGWPLLAYTGSIALALVIVPLAVWGLCAAWSERSSAARPATLTVVLPWLACPIVLPLVLSFIGSPIFLPKYTIAASVPFALLAGRGLAALPGRRWAMAVLVLIIGLSAWRPLDTATASAITTVQPADDLRKVLAGGTLTSYYETRRKDGWRDAVWNVEAAARPGDAVVFYPFFNQLPFDIYHHRTDLAELPYPKHAAMLTRTTLLTMTRDMVRPYRRVWFVVLQQEEVKPLLVAELERRFRTVTRIREWHIDVYLCERDGPDETPAGAIRAPESASGEPPH